MAEWAIEPEDFRRWTEDAATGTANATDWCTLLCSGRYDAVATAVLTAAAAACELGHPPTDAESFEPAGWTERLLAARTTPELLEAAVRQHRLAWTRLRVRTVTTPTRSVAEELRLQVLHDGADLLAAAAAAGCRGQEAESPQAGFAPASLQAALAGARRGDVVGPLPVGTAWALVQVLERTEPSLSDPATRALAEDGVHREVVARAVARHVVA